MRKLFVSFTSLMRLVTLGQVTAEDLRHGLFFFGCWREHALNPGAAGEPDERTWSEGRYAAAHPTIVEAVKRAESERRAAWHNGPRIVDSPWVVLDELLRDNGFSPLKPQSVLSCHYSYPGVRDAVTGQSLDLEVVY